MSKKTRPAGSSAAARRSPSRQTKRKTARPDAEISPPLPPLRSDAAVIDCRADFAKRSLANRPTAVQERYFIANKLKLLRTDPAMHPADRSSAATRFTAALADAASLDEIGPVPGGVGYGMFYNSAFKTAFATGTAISWEIVCPTKPGGNVDTWLYLTATNRSGKGVEAFVAYQGQDEFSFNIFDWARPEADRWRPETRFSNLGNYLGSELVHGIQCQVIAVMNTTFQQSPGNWVNEVRLLDVPANEWHLVYRFEYPATLQDQTGDWVGSWGPIVETFQDVYSNTNAMGALKTQIVSRDSSGNWGQWAQLTKTQSNLRTDNKGFVGSFLDENYSWSIHS